MSKLDLGDIIKKVNAAGDDIWKVKYEIEEESDSWLIWIIDEYEFLSSENYTQDWIWRKTFYPIEEEVKKQTGYNDFYLEPYNFAGRFVGRAFK